MLYHSTLLVLIIRLKPFLHEINWNFKIKTKLFSRQLKFSWVWDGLTSYKRRGAMQETKLCSIYILNSSDGCAQGPEPNISQQKTHSGVRSDLQTESYLLSSVWVIASCQSTIIALFWFPIFKG